MIAIVLGFSAAMTWGAIARPTIGSLGLAVVTDLVAAPVLLHTIISTELHIDAAQVIVHRGLFPSGHAQTGAIRDVVIGPKTVRFLGGDTGTKILLKTSRFMKLEDLAAACNQHSLRWRRSTL